MYARVSFVAALAACAGVCSADVLPANPGPSNNGGSSGWAMFFDLEALSGPVTVTSLTTGNSGAANTAFSVEVFTRVGTALGGPVAAGPGSSSAGWTSLGIVPATQGPLASGVSLDIDIPDIALTPGGVTGVALKFTTAGPRYFGTGTPPLSIYQDANLKLTTGEGRSAPFTTGGSYFVSRAMVGAITYTAGGGCYANCDGSTATPVLTANDFQCFLNKYATNDPGANCDESTSEPVLTANDFQCFLNKYATGCS